LPPGGAPPGAPAQAPRSMTNPGPPRCRRGPPPRPGPSPPSKMTTSRLRAPPSPSSAAGSKKYSAGAVATTLTAWPAWRNAAYSAGVWIAATDPVTPTKTLAMAPPPVLLDRGQEARGQLVPGHTLVGPAQRPQVGPLRRPFQRVGHHQVGIGVTARPLGDVDQLVLAQADLELELDQHAPKPPLGPDLVHQFRGAQQSQP